MMAVKINFDDIAEAISPDQLADVMGVVATGSPGSGKNYRCPLSAVHRNGDKNASFSISKTNGRTVARCFACGLEGSPVQIAAKVWGLEQTEAARKLAARIGLSAGGGERGVSRSRKRPEQSNTPEGTQSATDEDRSGEDVNGLTEPEHHSGCNLEQYAKAKRLPIDFLKSVGVSQIPHHPAAEGPAVRIAYHWPDGSEAAVQYRIALKAENPFRFKSGSKALLYGLERLQEAKDAGYLVLAEGASDSHTLWHHGIPALGLPGASSWKEQWAEYFDGIERIYVIDEQDTGAEAIRKWLAGSSIRHRVQLVSLGEHKDPSELHLHNPDGFKAAWAQAIEAAESWVELEQTERNAQAKEDFANAEDLLRDPDILERVREAIQANGYAGSPTAPLLAFIALVSRLLERPMNLAFVAVSAAGKNRTVAEALRLTPESGYHLQMAGSARSLIYTDADFKHRTVVAWEADSLPQEGPASSAVRSIAEDNVMEYEVVEPDPKTKQWHTRKIRKEGPTGIITTSTKSLGPQFGTRTLEVPIPDDDEQTRKILTAHAREAAGTHEEPPSPDVFHALQGWLERAGERRVVVPFAEEITDLIPPRAVALRRHGKQLFTAIMTIAFMHQLSREHTADGKIIATVDDYAQARKLLAPLFQSVVSEGLPDALRETVEAVKKDETLTVAEIAKRLKVSKSAASSRVKRAIREGWLQNKEHRKGHAAQVKHGGPLPDATTGLPRVEDVREAFRLGQTLVKADATPKTQAGEGLSGGCSGVQAGSGREAPLSPLVPEQDGLFTTDPKPRKEEQWTTI